MNREELIIILEMITRYSREYLITLPLEELQKLYEERR